MKKPVVIALLLSALILAACGQKAGVHKLAAGGNSGLAGDQSGTGAGGDLGGAGGGSSAASGGSAIGALGGGGAAAGAGVGGAAAGRAGGGGGGAGSAASAGGAGDTTGVTDGTITIGLHAPVTGAAPFPTTSFQDGKDLYFNYLNTKGGINNRKVNVVFEDDGYNPSQAVSVCKKMVEQDHVFMLVGGGGTDQIVACANYAASVGVPYVAEGVSEQGLNTLQNYFALSMTYKAQAPLLAEYMKNVLHVTKVGMIRGNTANFDDAHTAFLQAAAANGLQVVFDRAIDKNADAQTAATAGGSICSNATNKPEAVYPLIAPTIWAQIVAGASAQACTPIWAGVGLTEGLNTVGTAVCGAAPETSGRAHFFSPFPGWNVTDQFDPAYRQEFARQHPSSKIDDISWALWSAEKLLAAELAAPGRNLTRQSFISAVNGHAFATGIYPPVNYASSRFGGTAVHVVKLNCGDANSPYENEANFKTGF
ncbi:MAG: ABC transporter substrate-binding protein [Acidimicrobiia bacterium]|nr:ABC transporter substrate-binding protein [Acidimicrobiia bacterium]